MERFNHRCSCRSYSIIKQNMILNYCDSSIEDCLNCLCVSLHLVRTSLHNSYLFLCLNVSSLNLVKICACSLFEWSLSPSSSLAFFFVSKKWTFYKLFGMRVELRMLHGILGFRSGICRIMNFYMGVELNVRTSYYTVVLT